MVASRPIADLAERASRLRRALGRRARLPRIVWLAAALMSLAAAPTSAQQCITLEDFSTGTIGELPPGWKLRSDEGRGVYALAEQGGRRFLRADSKGIGIQAAKEIGWDLARYPVLAWSWRAVEFPANADERNAKTNDSAVSVYAAFPYRMGSVKAVKFIWSAIVPVGTALSSNMGLTKARVVQSGTQDKGRWVEEKVNVLEAYRKGFDTSDTPKPAGIAVLTDSDDTKSRAQGDYANFRACAP